MNGLMDSYKENRPSTASYSTRPFYSVRDNLSKNAFDWESLNARRLDSLKLKNENLNILQSNDGNFEEDNKTTLRISLFKHPDFQDELLAPKGSDLIRAERNFKDVRISALKAANNLPINLKNELKVNQGYQLSEHFSPRTKKSEDNETDLNGSETYAVTHEFEPFMLHPLKEGREPLDLSVLNQGQNLMLCAPICNMPSMRNNDINMIPNYYQYPCIDLEERKILRFLSDELEAAEDDEFLLEDASLFKRAYYALKGLFYKREDSIEFQV